MKAVISLFIVFILFAMTAYGAGRQYVPASAKDKCAVCGMFVARYASWTAEIVFQDNSRVFFDGPKDLFKYLTDLKTFAPSRRQADVAAVYVSDYYAVTPINGFEAFYVTGSDVNGPMGPEFVSFKDEKDAREFMKDHHGNRILRFRDITAQIIKALE